MFAPPLMKPQYLLLILISIGAAGLLYFFFGAERSETAQIGDVELSQAESLFNNAEFAQGHSFLDVALERNPNDVTALLAKSRLIAQQASLELKEVDLGNQAMVYIDKALSIQPSNVDALTLKGYVYEIQQRYGEADAFYDKALAINPGFAYALAQKGHSLQLQGKEKAALPLYEQALAIENNNPIALFGLGKIYTNMGMYDKAKEHFLSVAHSNTNSRLKAEGFYSAALVADAAGENHLQEMEQLTSSAIAVDPLYPQAYVARSKISLAKSVSTDIESERTAFINASFEDLNTAIQLNPKLAFAHLQLATQLYMLQRLSDARIILNNLPSIIASDISLSASEKEMFNNIVKGLKEKIQ